MKLFLVLLAVASASMANRARCAVAATTFQGVLASKGDDDSSSGGGSCAVSDVKSIITCSGSCTVGGVAVCTPRTIDTGASLPAGTDFSAIPTKQTTTSSIEAAGCTTTTTTTTCTTAAACTTVKDAAVAPMTVSCS